MIQLTCGTSRTPTQFKTGNLTRPQVTALRELETHPHTDYWLPPGGDRLPRTSGNPLVILRATKDGQVECVTIHPDGATTHGKSQGKLALAASLN